MTSVRISRSAGRWLFPVSPCRQGSTCSGLSTPAAECDSSIERRRHAAVRDVLWYPRAAHRYPERTGSPFHGNSRRHAGGNSKLVDPARVPGSSAPSDTRRESMSGCKAHNRVRYHPAVGLQRPRSDVNERAAGRPLVFKPLSLKQARFDSAGHHSSARCGVDRAPCQGRQPASAGRAKREPWCTRHEHRTTR